MNKTTKTQLNKIEKNAEQIKTDQSAVKKDLLSAIGELVCVHADLSISKTCLEKNTGLLEQLNFNFEELDSYQT